MLVVDLLAFDRERLGWRLATRTLVGLLVPLLAAHYLDRPALVWMAFGAFLLAIGDSVDDGDRLQPLRLAAGALLGGLALATGVLVGGNLLLALCGMLIWGVVAGLMGVYGNAAASMGLPVAWAYVELGLPSAGHSPAHAALAGGMFALGGGLMLILTCVVRTGGPYGPLTERTAACFRAVADYLDVASVKPTSTVVSPETEVRAAIAEARRAAAAIRYSQQAASEAGQRQRILIELADRLFSRVGARREWQSFSSPRSRDAASTLAAAAREVARAISGKLAPARMRELAAELERLSAGAAGLGPGVEPRPEAVEEPERALDRRIARDLGHALNILLGQVTAGVPEAASPAIEVRLASVLEPLRACLDRNSVVARHALRFGVVACLAVLVFWVFPPPFGYWVPLTVTVVLKPYAGMTLTRTVQRICGTALGILLGMALMPLLEGSVARVAAVATAFFCMMAVLRFNYAMAIFFLSLGLIPFEHLLTPGLPPDVGFLRLEATAIGTALAVVGGHLLWPSFERNELPAMLGRGLRSMADYAAASLQAAEGEAPAAGLAEARRRSGLDLTNLHATTQRALGELGGDRAMIDGVVVAATALQRMSLTLNAIVNAVPAVAPLHPELSDARTAIEGALRGLAEGTLPPSDPTAGLHDAARRLAGRRHSADGEAARTIAFLEEELERLAAQVEMLAGARVASAPS